MLTKQVFGCIYRNVLHSWKPTLTMASVSSARDLTWDTVREIHCNNGPACHTYHLFDNNYAALDHDRIFTHVHDDNIMLDSRYATIKSEILATPNLTYNDFVNMIWTEECINDMIVGTNEYGYDNDMHNYTPIPLSNLGRCEFKLVIGSYILQKEKNMTVHELLANDESSSVLWLTAELSQKRFREIRKNLCFNGYQHLEDLEVIRRCTDKFQHNLQKLIGNSNSLIVIPKVSVLDEIRTVDNSQRSMFGTFIQNKPIKRGRTTDAICVKLLTRDRHLLDGLAIALNPNKGKKDSFDETIATTIVPGYKENLTENKVHQIIKWKHDNQAISGNSILSMDKGYNSLYAMEKLLPHYGIKSCGPIQAGRKCLPKVFGSPRFAKLRKKLKKGDYKQWYTNDGTHLTLFRDSKFVNIFDNCIDQNRLAVIRRRKKKEERNGSRRWKEKYVVPKCIEYYNETMGSVDAANARRKKHMIGNKNERKHNRCYLGLFDQVVLQNSALMYAAYKKWKRVDQTKLRLELCRTWVREYQLAKAAEGGVRRKSKRKTISALRNTLLSRGIGSNHIHRLVHIGAHRTSKIKCYVHKKIQTWYKCDTCMIQGQETGFCHPAHCRGGARTCFADFSLHVHHQIGDA